MKTFLLKSNPKKRAVKRSKKRARVIHIRRNPPRRSRSEYLVEALVRTRTKRFKTYWYTGKGFTRERDKAERYPNEFAASGVARRILPYMNDKALGLRVIAA